MAQRLAVLPFVLFAVGCAHSAQLTWNVDDPEAMRAVLAEHIPPGTPVAEARQFMQEEGFTCRERVNESFVERTWFGDRDPRHEGIDFVHCERVQTLGVGKQGFGLGGLMMTRNWDVALVNDSRSVTAVLVSHYLDGP